MMTLTLTTPRTLDYPEWLRTAAAEYERVEELVAGIPSADWAAPTDCAPWTVADVVAHLSGAAAATASPRELIRQAAHGRRSSAAGDLVDKMNAVQVRERSGWAPARLRADLTANAAAGLRARRRLPSPLLATPMPFGPPLGVRPLGYLMGRIYTRDLWMHRVDLTRATGRPLHLDSDHDGRLIEDVVAEWAHTHGRDYVLHLDGPAGGLWERRTSTEAPTGPIPHLTLDAVEFARIMSGRATGNGLLSHTVPF